MKLKWKELVASLIVIWLPLIYALSIYADLPQLIRGHLPYSGLGMPKQVFIWFLPVLLSVIQLIVCYTTTIKEIIDKQFVHFLLLRSTRPAGQKELIIDMIALADELVTTRLRVSQMLNRLKSEGLIELRRRHIIIPSFEKLLQHLQ